MSSLGNFKHGMTGTRTYYLWQGMKERCLNPANTAFEHYGGRGITFQASWADFQSFFADMGECLEGFSLERLKVNEGYSKGNCKWIPLADQQKNKRTCVRILHKGAIYCLFDAVKLTSIPYTTVRSRLKIGKTPEQALGPDFHYPPQEG